MQEGYPPLPKEELFIRVPFERHYRCFAEANHAHVSSIAELSLHGAQSKDGRIPNTRKQCITKA